MRSIWAKFAFLMRWWIESFLKLCLSTAVLMAVFASVLVVGCKERKARVLVAPIEKSPPYELEVRVSRNWGGDEYEAHEGAVIHYVMLLGVVGPEPGQRLFDEAGEFMRKRAKGKDAKLSVAFRDESECECGTLVLNKDGTDLAKLLLRRGFGWVDPKAEIDEEYRIALQAEMEFAQEQGRGVWAYDSPQPPWEYKTDAIKWFQKTLREESKANVTNMESKQ